MLDRISGVQLCTHSTQAPLPQVYYLISTTKGLTIFEDIQPGLPSAYRRLKEYFAISGDRCSKLRIQSPHNLYDVRGNDYRAIYRKNYIRKDFLDPNREDLNGLTLVYAALNEVSWEVHTTWDSQNYLHFGYHQARTLEWLDKDATEHDLKHAIALNDIGTILFT